MDNIEILKHFRKTADIQDEEFEKFLLFSKLRVVKKNTILIEQGKDISSIFFIKSGWLVTYFEDKNKFNHVIHFGTDTWWTGDFQSATYKNPSIYTIKALADSAILEFSIEALETLIEDAPNFQKYFRYLFQFALASQQKRNIDNISLSAEQRYESFLKIYPKSELIIPQKFIASYLGITPEFLSKMKSKMYAVQN
jgi:CRP-like cAMP-binding protein